MQRLKTNHYRNRALLDLADGAECAICGAQDGTVVAAHSNQSRHGKGAGIKAEDCFTAALCYSCHSRLDQGGVSRERASTLFDAAMRRTLAQYIAGGKVMIDDETIKELWSSGKLTVMR